MRRRAISEGNILMRENEGLMKKAIVLMYD